MIPRRLSPSAPPLPTPSTAGARPDNAAGDNPVPQRTGGLSAEGKTWQLPRIGAIVVPPQADASASPFKDGDIDKLLTVLSQQRDPQAFSELPDAQGERQIQCRFAVAGNSTMVVTLRLDRHDWLCKLILQKVDARGRSMGEHQAQFQPMSSAAATLQPHAPSRLAAAQAGDATVSGRKRQLPPSSLPRAPRPRTEVGPLHAAPATVPRTHAALQQQAQRIQALDAALRTFQMEWASLSVQERQAIVDAATHLPPRPYPDGMTEAALQQQQLHAVLTPLQPALPPKKSVKKKFLEGLKPYAEGKSLVICESESRLVNFHEYLTAAGGLSEGDRGQRLYAKLSLEEQEKVNKAIEQRKLALPPKESVKTKFLEGLKPYAEGKDLAICAHESRLADFHHYLTTAGGLSEDDRGQRFYAKLSLEEQEKVNKAIEQRKKLALISQRLLAITAAFTDPLLSLEGVAQKTKVDIAALRLILTESGLTELGKEALSKRNKLTQCAVEDNLSLREQKKS